MLRKAHPEHILLLASNSQRRQEILTQLKIEYKTIKVPPPPGEDEPRLPGETVTQYVVRTAKEKAQRAQEFIVTNKYGSNHLSQHTFIITADTCVCMDQDILAKPLDKNDAKNTLTRLSGNKHTVYTAVCIAHNHQYLESLSKTEVVMKSLSQEEIEYYSSSSEPYGKAGSYGIQGLAAVFISRINGSYTGVMGLPAHETYLLLKKSGFLA